MKARWVWTTGPGRFLLAAAVVVVAWQSWLALAADRKLPPNLQASVSPRGTVDLLVRLRFPPERFHILMFQRFGRVSGTEGNAVEVRSVPVGRVREIARFYWVDTITPLPREGGLP